MSIKFITSLLFLFIIITPTYAQLSISSSYLNSSDFKNENGDKEGKVNTFLLNGMLNVPFSMKISEDKKEMSIWSAYVTGKYMKMNETNSPRVYPFSKILNLYGGVSHYKTLTEKWKLSIAGGMGICTDNTRFSQIRSDNLMVYGMGIAIYKVNNNLELGGGLAFSNSFNIPMVFPSIYARWKGDGKFRFELATRSYDIKSSLGIDINSYFRLSAICEYNRISTPLEDADSKDYYYSFNYLTTGLRPEIKVSKLISIPIEVGAVFGGSGSYKKRKLSHILKSDDSYSFGASPYVSISLKVGIPD